MMAALTSCIVVTSPGAMASSNVTSELLIVLAADGSYRARHILNSEGGHVRLAFPDDADIESVRFLGAERVRHQSRWSRQPEGHAPRLILDSGSAIIDYRRRYTLVANNATTGNATVQVLSVPTGLTVSDNTRLLSRVTWWLPHGAELTDYSRAAESADEIPTAAGGRWIPGDGIVSWEQSSDTAIRLQLSWRSHTADEASCNDGDAVCMTDVDNDGIPDERDVCLPAALDTTGDSSASESTGSLASSVDPFGCALQNGIAQQPLPLEDVRFSSGQSYLELSARRQLDRLARALLRDPRSVYEIATHTDRAGRFKRNLTLSERRARAVRHYLMLRGIGPNQLQARGYGESQPPGGSDSTLPASRQRRVEIRRLD